MKKLFILLCILTLIPLAAAASSGVVLNAPMVDIEHNSVAINGRLTSGASGIIVMLEVLNPDKTLGDISNNPAALQKIDQKVSEDGGGFSFDFSIYLGANARSGIYNVYVTAADSNVSQQTSFYFATPADREIALIAIRGAQTQQQMAEKLSQYEQMLSLSFPPYDSVTKDNLAKNILASLDKDPSLAKTPGKFQGLVQELSIVEAFNQNKSNVVINENGEFLYPQVLQLSAIDEAYGITAYSVYSTMLTDLGKLQVRNSLFGKGYKYLAGFQREFAAQTLLQGFKNVKVGGYGHVRDLLLKNASYVGLKLNVYSQLSERDKSSVDSSLMSAESASIIDLQTKLDSLITALGNKQSSGGKGGSSGGSSGGGFQVDGTVPAQTPVPASQQSKYFKDMQNAAWAVTAVDTLAQANTVVGDGDGIFAPNNTVTREQFITMIIRGFKFKISYENSGFSDVDESGWYSVYVAAAKEAGLTKGKPDGTFGVGEPISREDAAVIARRAAELLKLELKKGETKQFADTDQISDYAAQAVDALAQAKVINGMPDGTFVPKGNITRAEAAVIIYNLMK